MESVFRFGKDDCLMGIISEPEGDKPRNGAPAVIFLNAGLLHRVGPYRLSTDLARRLAAIGYNALRFDLSGIGDSDIRADLLSYKQSAVDDTIDAMDFMFTEREKKEFVLIGLCSGADNAHRIALADPRVVGVVFLDAYGFRTPGFYLHFYARRIWRSFFKVGKWKRLLTRKYHQVRAKSKLESREEIFPRNFPPKEEARRDILQLIDRGVHLLYVYTSGVEYYYSYPRQFEDMLGLKLQDVGDQLQVRYIRESDHVYTMLEDRANLIATVCRWMYKHYGAAKVGQKNA